MNITIKNNYFFGVISLYAAMYLLSLAVMFTDAAQVNSIESITGQIQEIDITIAAFENELSQNSQKMSQISQDSARIVLEGQTLLLQVHEKIRLIDQQITAKNKEIANSRSERAKVYGDSVFAAQTFHTERNALQVKISDLERLVNSTSGEITLLKQKRAQLHQYSLQPSDPQVLMLHAEKRKLDSLLIVRQEMLNVANARKTELSKDSVAQASVLLLAQEKNDNALQLAQSELQTVENSVNSSKSVLDQFRAALTEKKMIINSAAQKLISRKAKVASSSAQIIAKIKKMELELAKLQVSAGALQKKYAEGRTPITKQLATIVNTLQTREQQKEIWLLMKEKHVIDSSIVAVRNEFDEQIQLVASGKRAAQKNVDQKEKELNALLGKKDNIMSNPEIKHMQGQLTSLTMAQRHARIEQVLSNIMEDISKQTTLKLQTEQTLAQFDAANPINNNPSIQRYRQLDSLVALDKQQNELLKGQIDSIDIAIRSHNDSIMNIDASARNEIVLYEKAINSAITQKSAVVAKLDQIKRDALVNRTNNSASYNKVIGELAAIYQKTLALEREIGATQNQSAEIKNRITVSQQKFEQSKAAAIKEVGSLDMQIIEKENTISKLSAQSSQLSGQLTLLKSNIEQTFAVSTALMSSVDQRLKVKNGELQQLYSQRKTLVSETEIVQKKQNSALLAHWSSLTNLQKRTIAVKSQIQSLQLNRSRLIQSIQSKIADINKSINLTQNVMDGSNTSYSTALQDSINFEQVRANAYIQFKAKIARQDSVVAAIQSQFKTAIAEFEKARKDSTNTANIALSSVYPHSKKIHALDSSILIKERELLTLRNARSQAVQDSVTEATNARMTVTQAQTRVRQKSDAITSLEQQAAIQDKEKKRIESDAIATGEQFKRSRETHSSTLSRYLKQISENRQKLENLRSELNFAENALSIVQGNRKDNTVAPVAKSTINNSSTAQAMIEKIYALMGEDKMKEAHTLFVAQKNQLQKYAPAEAIQTLEASF
jgi:predicted  nucleic acid-binding Zn-ribbon protein